MCFKRCGSIVQDRIVQDRIVQDRIVQDRIVPGLWAIPT
jgi:hypothetical protein